MAQLKDTLITGSLRVTDTIFSTNLNLSSLTASYAVLTDTNKNLTSRGITNNTSATAVTASDNLITANTLYYHKGNSNIVTVGTITTGTWSGTEIAVGKGGTGKTSWTKGGIIYASATDTLSQIGDGSANKVLRATNSATYDWLSYTDANTASTLVYRDASKNFSAGTITATLSGNATSATKANITSNKYGVAYYSDTAGTFATTAQGTSGYVLQAGGNNNAPSWINATNSNTANTIVKRDANGNFSAGTISANGYIDIKNSTIDLKNASNSVSDDTGYMLRSFDKNDYGFAVFEGMAKSNGSVFAYMGVQNRNTSGEAQGWKGLSVSADKAGNCSYAVSDQAAFRTAISAAASDHTHGWANLTDNADSLSSGSSDVTASTEILTSYASNNGFSDTSGKGKVYRRAASKVVNATLVKAALSCDSSTTTKWLNQKGAWSTPTAAQVGAAPSSTVSCTTANVKTALGCDTSTINQWLNKKGEWSTPTAAQVGAATSGHNHDSTYLKLDGGTITGALTADTLFSYGTQYIQNNTMDLKNTDGHNGCANSDTALYTAYDGKDKNGNNYFAVEGYATYSGATVAALYIKNYDGTTDRGWTGLTISKTKAGTVTTTLPGTINCSNTIVSTAGTVITAKPASSRVYLELIPQGDYQADVAFGRSNAKTWSLSSRATSDAFFGLYNHKATAHWSIQIAESDDTATFAGKITIDNTTNSTTDYTNNALYVKGGGGFAKDVLIDNGWIRTFGEKGWYNGTHGGGWTMTDDNTIKMHGNKKVVITSSTAASSTNLSSQLIVGSVAYNEAINTVSGSAVGLELWRGANASWQIINDAGTLHFKNNWTTAKQTTYTQDSVSIAYNTGNITTAGTLTTGSTITSGASIHAGTTSDTAERSVRARSAAGQFYIFSGNSSTASKGIYAYNAAGTAVNVLTLDQNNRITQLAPIAHLLTIYRESTTTANDPAGIVFKVKDTTTNQLYDSAYIYVYQDHGATTYGANMVIRSGGNMVIGGGESASGLYNAILKTSTAENLWLTSDSTVYVYANCNTIDNRLGIAISTAGEVLPWKAEAANNNAQNLGATTNKWANVYATSIFCNAWAATEDCWVERSTSTATSIGIKRTDSSLWCALHVNMYGQNHGVYSSGYYNGTTYTSAGKWLIYRDKDGYICMPDTLSVLKSSDAAWEGFHMYNNNYSVAILRLQTVGTTSQEGWADLVLGNNRSSTTANNASGRIYFYESNGGYMYIRGMYGTLAGSTRKYVEDNQWFKAAGVVNAVWNDYAECRNVDTDDRGYCVTETPSGQMVKTTERLQAGCKITSDTFGSCMGETAEAKTPIAVSGRVLVYPYRAREEYQLGAAVCSAPDGKVDIMTRDEIMMYPERIVGTVSEIPTYEIWYGGNQDGESDIQVNGRIWIYVK